MNHLPGLGLSARLLLVGLLVAATGCRSALSPTAKYTCSERGGRIERVCVVQDPNDYTECHLYQEACVGATISLKQYEEQKRRQRNGGPGVGDSYAPQQLTDAEREESRRRLWIKQLNRVDKKRLKNDAKGHPEVSWLAGFWCSTTGNHELPTHYFRVSTTALNKLEIRYYSETIDVNFNNYIKIHDMYYDLSGETTVTYPGKYIYYRLHKYSDDEYALVYENELPTARFRRMRLEEIGPEDHIVDAEIFRRCDYKRR